MVGFPPQNSGPCAVWAGKAPASEGGRYNDKNRPKRKADSSHKNRALEKSASLRSE